MDEGVTDGGPIEGPVSGTGTVSVSTVGMGSAAEPVVTSAAATGVGSIADRMPNQDRPMATMVTNAQATRYPIDRLTAANLP